MTDSLEGLIADLGKVHSALYKTVEQTLEKGALELKDQLNANLAASTHFRGAAGSVTYDGMVSFGSVGFEVGPDKGRRGGALANIAFFGTSRGGGTVDMDGPVRSIGARTERFLGLAAEGLL
jgi:hypothetical protein